jgi:hypothetical protein
MWEALFYTNGNQSLKKLMYTVNINTTPKKAETLTKRENTDKHPYTTQQFERIKEEICTPLLQQAIKEAHEAQTALFDNMETLRARTMGTYFFVVPIDCTYVGYFGSKFARFV